MAQFDRIKRTTKTASDVGINVYIHPLLSYFVLSSRLHRLAGASEISNISSTANASTKRNYDISIDRGADEDMRLSRYWCEEVLCIADFSEDRPPGRYGLEGAIYVPSIWADQWKEIVLTEKAFAGLRATVIDDAAIALQMSSQSAALCLFDRSLLGIATPGRDYKIVQGLWRKTGAYYKAEASRPELHNVLSLLCGWMDGVDFDSTARLSVPARTPDRPALTCAT